MTYTDPPEAPKPVGLTAAIGVLCLLAGAVLVIAYCGCTPTAQQKAEHAIIVGTYERELEACKEQGKASRSYDVYEACAKAVDFRLCNERGLRCKPEWKDGGR